MEQLFDIVDAIAASGHPSLLDTSIGELIEEVEWTAGTRALLQTARFRDGAVTLADLLHDDRMQQWVWGTMSPSELARNRDALLIWVHNAAQLDSFSTAPQPELLAPRETDAPPDGREPFVEWMNEHGLTHLLGAEFSQLVQSVYVYGARGTLLDFWSDAPEALQRLNRYGQTEVRRELRHRLTRLAPVGQAALDNERAFLEELDARIPQLSGDIAVVAANALAQRAAARALSAPPLADVSLPQLRFSARPPQVTATLQIAHPYYAAFPVHGQATVGIFDAAAQGVRVQSVSAMHTVLVLDAFLLVLLKPTDPLHIDVTAAIAQPAWQQTLAALDEAIGGATEAEETPNILSWRLMLSHTHDVRLVPYMHKPLKRGGYSLGSAADADRLSHARNVSLLPSDVTLLRTQRAGRSYTSTREELAEQLFALIDHPRVLTDTQEPLAITRVQPTLTLQPAGEGAWRMKLLVNNEPLPPEALPHEAGFGFVVQLAAHEVAVFKLTKAEHALLTAVSTFDATIPANAVESVLSRLQQSSAPIVVPEHLRGDPVTANTQPVARLTPESQALRVEFFMRPLGVAPLVKAGLGAPVMTGEIAGVRRHTTRDFSAERQAVEHAGHLLELELEDGKAVIVGEAAMLAFLSRLREQTAIETEWLRDPMTVSRPLGAKGLKVSVRSGRDWFGLEGDAQIDGETFNLALLLDALRRGDRFVKIGERRWVQLEENLRERLELLALATQQTKHGVEVGLPAVQALEALRAAGAEVDLGAKFSKVLTQIKEVEDFLPALPETLSAELRPYQIDGFNWMCRLEAWGTGGILADDMGLGKTVQALAMLLRRAGLGPALVVMPTSLEFNWLREAERFAPSLRVRTLRALGTLPDDLRYGDVILVSYGLLAREGEALAQHQFATCIFDEAQALKNADTQRAKAARGLDYAWGLALTGTPVENRTADLWSVLRLVTPGLLGSWEQFRARFAAPIEGGTDPKRRQQLARLVRPFVLRRTKSLVLSELPEKTEIDVGVVLSDEERSLYEQARLAAIARIEKADGQASARFSALAALTELRRLVCNPRLYDARTTAQSSKQETLLRMIDDLRENGHRALVFSQFTTHLALVREALDARGVTYQYLDGQTPEAERARRVDAFQRGEGELFLISLKAGGTGLNLTAADYVFHLDPWWNPAVEAQAAGRAHRIGQERPVTVYRLIAKDTIEEKIVAMHKEKRELAESLLGESTGVSAVMAANEVLALLTEASA